jgi:CRISPR-associated protein Cas1
MFDEEVESRPAVRVMALHALVYCQRLFYLEEVEEIRVADAAVLAGRTLHEELEEPVEVVSLTLESQELGLRGRLDAIRRRDGSIFPVEHKRGRAMKGADGKPAAWDSDRMQLAAYAMLLEEHAGVPVREGRIRYHKDNVTVRVQVGFSERADVHDAVTMARAIAARPERPSVTMNERKCVRCSLAPVCLPEEARLASVTLPSGGETAAEPRVVRLFPPDQERRSLHVLTQGAKVGRSSDLLLVSELDRGPQKVGPREVSDVVIHGHAQITTQALRFCADEEIPVHFVTTSGAYLGSFHGPSGGVQRRIRQFRGLTDETLALELARRLVAAKIEMQLRHVLRGTRKDSGLREQTEESLLVMRQCLRRSSKATTRDQLLGEEGLAARAYFASLAGLVVPEAGEEMIPRGRSRRPPEDRFNALLSFGYGLLYKDVHSALLRVGLEPSFGVLHQPRSAAFPLVLDLAELFRVPVVDMAVLGAVNRRTFDPVEDFVVTGKQVWLSETGRRKLIEVYERRKHEEYRHDRLGYSLSYSRMMEVETRLLEKEWSGEPGLFATFRIR